MEDMYEEVLLCFKYYGETRIEDAKKLCEILKENNIDFCAYDVKGEYCPKFYVRRCGKKWNDIMRIINGVRAPFYRKEKRHFKIVEKLELGIGNLQTYYVCSI